MDWLRSEDLKEEMVGELPNFHYTQLPDVGDPY